MCTPKMELDYYAILEITSIATATEIRGAYKRLALIRHPDKNGGSCAAFQELNEAHEILSDTFRRGTYDLKYERIKAEHERKRKAEKAEWERKESVRISREKLEKAEAERKAKERRDKDAKEERERQWVATEATWQGRIRVLRAEVEPLEKQSAEWSEKEKERERNAKPGWFGYFFKAAETEEEKMKREQERLQGLASERIRQMKLEKLKEKLTHLQTQYEGFVRARKEAVEAEQREKAAKVRIAKEKEDRELREKLAKAQKEQREREYREGQARMKEAEERSRKEREERLKREKLARERMEQWMREEEARQKRDEERLRKEREEREEKLRREREARERARREQEALRKQEEDRQREEDIAAYERIISELKRQRDGAGSEPGANTWHRTAGSTYTPPTRRVGRGANVRPQAACRHAGFWPKISGPNQCGICREYFNAFILECPQCDLKACVSCKRGLQRH